MNKQRAAITGLGIVAPTGVGKATFWHAITTGVSPISEITRFDTTSYPCRIAAEIPEATFAQFAPAKKVRTAGRSSLYALAATDLALADARLSLAAYEPGKRAVCLGTSLGGFHEAYQQMGVLAEKGAGRVNPFLTQGSANHAAGLEVASYLGAQGPHYTLSTGCTSSLQAIALGADLVSSGVADVCVAGGTEAPISPLVVAAMCRSRELSTANADPKGASRPFDRGHDGLVLSEGSAMVVLERVRSARERGAHIYAEIVAHACGADAAEPFRNTDDYTPAVAILNRCLMQSGDGITSIDYVCANGNSLPFMDRKELWVLGAVAAGSGKMVPVSSIKGVTGHSLGAAGAFQVGASCLAIRSGIIPANSNLVDPEPSSGVELVVGGSRERRLRNVLVSNYGFGGMNAFLVLADVGG